MTIPPHCTITSNEEVCDAILEKAIHKGYEANTTIQCGSVRSNLICIQIRPTQPFKPVFLVSNLVLGRIQGLMFAD